MKLLNARLVRLAPLFLILCVAGFLLQAGMFGSAKLANTSPEAEGLTIFLTALLKDNEGRIEEAIRFYKQAPQHRRSDL
jgi:hypothetical protein